METITKSLLFNTSIAITIISLSQLAAWLFRTMASKNGKKILEPLTNASDDQLTELEKPPLNNNDNNKHLISLFKIVRYRKKHHETIFLKLYQYHFASVSMLLILSVISAIIVFIVAQDGLHSVCICLKTVFYTMAALTTFYALSPIVYKQDITISRNLKNYIVFDNIQNDIYNFIITNPSTPSNSQEFNDFHTGLMKKISENNSIDLDFDFKSIKTPDFMKIRE